MKRKIKLDIMVMTAVSITLAENKLKFIHFPKEPVSLKSDHKNPFHHSEMISKIWLQNSKKIADFKRAENILGLTASLKNLSK